jgi:hypothetical protein
MLDASGSAAGVLGEADHVLKELEAENRDNWEQRAEMQAWRVISHTAIANENLRAADWTLRDCHEYLEELDDELRAWQRVARELSLSELSNKMRTTAKKRANDVDTEVNRARRLIERIILAIESGEPPDQRSEARRRDVPSAPQAEQPDAQDAGKNLGACCREGPCSIWSQMGQTAGRQTA